MSLLDTLNMKPVSARSAATVNPKPESSPSATSDTITLDELRAIMDHCKHTGLDLRTYLRVVVFNDKG